jgi:hypothetical protein
MWKLFLFCYLIGVTSLRFRVIKTAIHPLTPFIKQHHTVVVEKHNRLLYTVDFTPLNQSDPIIVCRLLFAQNVPAEVRVRLITNCDFFDDETIIYQWLRKPPCRTHPFTLDEWDNSTLNLYTHNCQHFSAFLCGYFFSA